MNASSLFPITSRYYGSEIATYVAPDGHEIAHLRRRFIPLPDRFVALDTHLVTEGERPDRLAARFLGDAEQFWRIADPNGVLRPEELTEIVGKRILITLAEGIPG